MSNPFKDKAIALGATGLWVADDLSAGSIPDSSGNGRSAMAVTGATVDTSDKPAAFTQSLVFDGVDDRAEIAFGAWMDTLHSDNVVDELYIVVVTRWGISTSSTQPEDYTHLIGRDEGWYGIRNATIADNDTVVHIRHSGGSRTRTFGSRKVYTDGWLTTEQRTIPNGGFPDPYLSFDAADPAQSSLGSLADPSDNGLADPPIVVGAELMADGVTYRRFWLGHIAAVAVFSYVPTLTDRQDLAASIDTAPSTNAAPVVDAGADDTATEGTAYSHAVSATDADADPLTLTCSALPTGLTFTDNGDGTGAVSGTPDTGTATGSPYTITITANDGTTTGTDDYILTVSEPAAAASGVFYVGDGTGMTSCEILFLSELGP